MAVGRIRRLQHSYDGDNRIIWKGLGLDDDATHTLDRDSERIKGDLLVIGRFEDEAPSRIEDMLNGELDGLFAATAERLLFKGKARVVTLDTLGRTASARIMILGQGAVGKRGHRR